MIYNNTIQNWLLSDNETSVAKRVLNTSWVYTIYFTDDKLRTFVK